MFDVDHFKRYNDTFGHDAGDAVLQSLSELVQCHIRAGDVACRYGGEEFLLLQPGMSAAHTLSLGVAAYPDHARLGTDLVKRADEALYRAKRGGRNRVVLSADAAVAEPFDTINR